MGYGLVDTSGVSHADLGKLDDAWRCIGEAMTRVETTKERCREPEVNRIAGEITLKSLERDTAKAQAYFRRALEVARAQQAKSWELRLRLVQIERVEPSVTSCRLAPED